MPFPPEGVKLCMEDSKKVLRAGRKSLFVEIIVLVRNKKKKTAEVLLLLF